MKHKLTLMMLCLPIFLIGQEIRRADALVEPKIARRTITVGGENAQVAGMDNQSIQFAIDALEQSGGMVHLNPGTFEITSPVRLKSGVHLVGSGKETILRRAAGVKSKFIVDADYGELKITVEDPDGFEIGMKVQVTDDHHNGCWAVSTAYITEIADNVIYVDQGMIRDYRSDLNGQITSSSSIIDVADAENVSISNLVIDGLRAKNYFVDGCKNAGILIFRSNNILVDGVEIKDFNGEGISWQITENVTIQHCDISGSGNTGLHPGTGSPFSIIKNNNVHHNDRDGLFICWRVYESQVSGNQFHHNGRYGICTGHKDTDVIFKGNHIFENASDGVHLRGEREANAPHRNTFINNIIENNGQNDGGYGFSINSPAKDLKLKGNIFKNSAQSQKAAIYVYKAGLKPSLEDNQFDEHPMGELVFESGR